jgi:hypothetical protein
MSGEGTQILSMINIKNLTACQMRYPMNMDGKTTFFAADGVRRLDILVYPRGTHGRI